MPHEMKLSQLRKGDHGVVVKIGSTNASLRLMEMGIVPGAHVAVSAVSPLGDAIAVRVANYTLSLRRSEVGSVLLAAD